MSDTKKICVVTGGTGGIGVSISKRLSKEGFTVIATCRPEKQPFIASLKKDLFGVDGNIHVYPVDVSCFDSCSGFVNQVGIDFGSISVLINNAGITRDSSIKKMDYEQWSSVISVNLGSVFNLSKLVFESMCDQGWGRIVNISSINGQKGQFGQVNYSAAKAGILGFTKSLAYEGARFGVTVNTVSPGYIETKMVAGLSDRVLNSIVSTIPMGRLGTPDEVAHAVLFLVGEESGFITGGNITINGGQHMF